jgi:hypothetical protein
MLFSILIELTSLIEYKRYGFKGFKIMEDDIEWASEDSLSISVHT